MDSFDSFCFPSLDCSTEKSSCVSDQQSAFVDSLLLPAYVLSPRSAMQAQATNTAMQQMASMQPSDDANNDSNMWLPQQYAPKQEMTMAAMYSMMMNLQANANHTSATNNSTDTPATIMNMLSMANTSLPVYSSSDISRSGNSVSLKREDSNSSMYELDREYDTSSTVSPFSTSDGTISSDEYPTPSISPVSQSSAGPTIQSQVKLENQALSAANTALTGTACEEQFTIEIITPPSYVLDNRRINSNPNSTTNLQPLKKRSSPSLAASANKKKVPSPIALSDNNNKQEELKVSEKSTCQKNKKRSNKLSSDSSDESGSDESDNEEQMAKPSKVSSCSSASSVSFASGCESKSRLARKAELARMSRRRKKMRLNDLEKEVKRLHEELAQLQNEANARQSNAHANMQLPIITSNSTMAIATATTTPTSTGTASNVSDDVDSQSLMCLMNEFVSAAKASQSSSDTYAAQRTDALLDLFVSRHAAFLRSGSVHLNALNEHVNSILPFQFLNWMCTQSDAFYQDPSGLWRSLLVDELHLSEEQLNDMDTFRHTVRKQAKHVVEIHKLFKRMSESMNKQSLFSLQNMERIRTVLTPQQFAHYIDWVQKFGEICLKMHQ